MKNQHFGQDNYTVVGLMAKYKIKKAEINLMINHLFDRRYYAAISEPYESNFYGAPRNFAGKVKYTF